MSQAADSTAAGSHARRAAHGESVRAGTSGETASSPERAPRRAPDQASSHLPVFAAFDELGFSGRDIAQLAEVTPPTVSKWRSGRVRIPDERVAFLTLALAHFVDEAKTVAELEAQCADGAGAWGTGWSARLDAARAHLAYQDVLNRDLAGGDVREGARQFRAWWSTGGARLMEEKHFTPQLDAALLETLKNKARGRKNER